MQTKLIGAVESPKHLLIFPASKKLINHDEVMYVIHRGWDVIIRNYVCNQYKRILLSQITYTYGDNIHAEAWLHTNPLDWITSVACLVGGSRRECRASLNHQIQFIVNLVVLKNHNKTKTRDYCQWKLRFHKRSGARVQNPPPSQAMVPLLSKGGLLRVTTTFL